MTTMTAETGSQAGAQAETLLELRGVNKSFGPVHVLQDVDFTARLGDYVVTPNLFHVPLDWDVDEDLLKDLVRARLAELD